jgi:transposase
VKGKLFVGIDWGHEECHVYAEDEEGSVIVDRRVSSEPASLQALAKNLTGLAGGSGVEVVVEATGGPVVQTMPGANFEVYAVNPKKVDRARELLSMSGAKDDRRDAYVALRLLRSFREAVCQLTPTAAQVVALRSAARRYQDTSEKLVAVRSQLRQLAWSYFPALTKLGDFDTFWMVALAEQIPSPLAAHAAEVASVSAILRQHRVRKFTAEQVLEVLRETAIEMASAEVEAHSFDLQLLCNQLRLLMQHRKLVRRRLEDLLERYSSDDPGPSDAEIVRSQPGAGAYVTATLIGEGLTALLQHDLDIARAYCGVAPVTRVTGKRQTRNRPQVVMRRACNTYLRRAMHAFCEKSLVFDAASRSRYATLRSRGHKHGRALRQLGDSKLKQLRAMLRDRTLFVPKVGMPDPT